MSRLGFPLDTDPRALAVVAIVERDGPRPRLQVRARGCGCALARIDHENELTVVHGVHVSRVAVAVDVDGRARYAEQHERFAVVLDDADDVELRCEHGAPRYGRGGMHGATLALLRARLAEVRRLGDHLLLP